MRIWIDRDRLAGYGLTVQDVENALRSQNAEIPAGRIESERPRIHRAVAHRRSTRRSSSATSSSRWPAAFRCGSAMWPRVELGSGGRTARQPLQRPAGHHRRHRQAGGRQSAGCVEGRASDAARDQRVPAAGPTGRDRQRQRPCSSSARSMRCSSPSARRSRWWCW